MNQEKKNYNRKKKPKDNKKPVSKYDEKIQVNASFEDLLKMAINTPAKKS